MSRDYTYHCIPCNRTPIEFAMNWGQPTLREIWAVRQHLIAIFDANIFYLDITIMGNLSSGDLWEFLREHGDHEVELQDEYGGSEPMQEEEKQEKTEKR